MRARETGTELCAGLDAGAILRAFSSDVAVVETRDEESLKKPLIIVESPTKARTIKKFLPARYVVKASVGHVRDLPKSTLGVDVESGDFTPRYLTIKGKGDVIKDLKSATKSATDVFLATDPDREGEAIAWHLAEILKLENPKRIELHEITKEAALKAIDEAHEINMDRVNAQQARRVLDRLVGYKISPLLWAKVRSGLSAGRVQSVAVKLVVDREREIEAFKAREYWTIDALLAKSAGSTVFPASLVEIDGVKFDVDNGGRADQIVADLQDASFAVSAVKQRETRRNAAAPFTTSTIQQEASRKLKFRVRKTMQTAQSLYEGVDLGSEGTQGLITYMRTDSTRISDGAREAAKAFIEETYGPEFYGGSKQFKVREGAQDAPRGDPSDVRHSHPGIARGRPEAGRDAALRAHMGALRRFADGRGRLRSDVRRYRRDPRSRQRALCVPRERERAEVRRVHESVRGRQRR